MLLKPVVPVGPETVKDMVVVVLFWVWFVLTCMLVICWEVMFPPVNCTLTVVVPLVATTVSGVGVTVGVGVGIGVVVEPLVMVTGWLVPVFSSLEAVMLKVPEFEMVTELYHSPFSKLPEVLGETEVPSAVRATVPVNEVTMLPTLSTATTRIRKAEPTDEELSVRTIKRSKSP